MLLKLLRFVEQRAAEGNQSLCYELVCPGGDKVPHRDIPIPDLPELPRLVLYLPRLLEVRHRDSPDAHPTRALVEPARIEEDLEYARLLHGRLVVRLKVSADADDASPKRVRQVGGDGAA